MLMSMVLTSVVISLLRKVYAVPPDACFAPFRWDDCGKDPTPVMYYWKPGSRCEVGMWRGCRPNINMFPDEYQCISTCVFSMRAKPDDYHSFNEIDEDLDYTHNTDDNDAVDSNSTDFNVTDDGNDTATNNNSSNDNDPETDGSTTEGPDGDVTSDPDGQTTETAETPEDS